MLDYESNSFEVEVGEIDCAIPPNCMTHGLKSERVCLGKVDVDGMQFSFVPGKDKTYAVYIYCQTVLKGCLEWLVCAQ